MCVRACVCAHVCACVHVCVFVCVCVHVSVCVFVCPEIVVLGVSNTKDLLCFAYPPLCCVLCQAVGASLRIFDLLDRIPQIKDGSQQLDNLKGEICFKNVVFRYPSRPEAEVLKVSLVLEWETVFLVSVV